MNIIGINLKNLRLKKNVTLDQLAAEISQRFDSKITNKDLLFMQEFIHLYISRKDKNPYR